MKTGDIVRFTVGGWKRYGVAAYEMGGCILVVDHHMGSSSGTVGENGWLLPEDLLTIVGHDPAFFWPSPARIDSITVPNV